MELLSNFIVIDTETTGCRPTFDKVTEVGLCHVVNGKIIERWQRLINPGVPIPGTIQKLTGITDELVADAPYFHEIAEELACILKNKIFIAHNARFDYAFLKNEFARCGLVLQEKTLCTVKLSRLLFPNYKSHSLDAIKARFNLTCKDRHRALGDADLLFDFINYIQKNIEKDTIEKAIKILLKRPSLPVHISMDTIQNIPDTAGVYKFYGDDNALLYIGKSISLRQRVLSHFAADHSNHKEMRMSQQIRSIEYIETAGELGALLLESELIKKELPIFNHRLRRYKDIFAIKLIQKDYYELDIVSFDETDLENTYGFFRKKKAAEERLRELVKEHQLCPKLSHLEKTKSACFYFQLKKCKGACCGKESPEIYNLRVKSALIGMGYKKWPYKGKIAIKEYCSRTERVNYHIFDQWCYLETVKSEADLFNNHYVAPKLDVDIYHMLRLFLKKKQKIQIIHLSPVRHCEELATKQSRVKG